MAAKKTRTASKSRKSAEKSSSLKQAPKFNKWLVLAAVAIVALIGGYLLGNSFAASETKSGSCSLTGIYIHNTIMKRGSRGECVKLLQNQLIAQKFLPKSGGGADGIFGSKTEGAVIYANAYYRNKSLKFASYCTTFALEYAHYYGRDNVGKIRSQLRQNFGGKCF